MHTETNAAPQPAKSEWKAPAVTRLAAGSAETGPGANGETNSLS